MTLRILAATLTACSLLFACGTSGDPLGKPVPDPKVDPCSASAITDCLVDQKACAMKSGSPVCNACANAEYAAKSGSCEPLPGQAISHAFAAFTTQPGQEVLGECQSWTLDNDTDIWVNGVELVQNEASHHSNWTFVPDTKYPGPDGVWNCADRSYDELSAAVAGGVLYAQSTQAVHEVQKFPEGAAVRIPAHSRIIGDVHLLNVSNAPITGHLDLTMYTLDVSEVTHRLSPFRMNYGTLDIPPLATSRFSGDCTLASDYESAVKKPYDVKVYYVLPHTHALGSRFFMQILGGAQDGQTLIDVRGFNGEARGRAYDPPVDLTGSTGLRFGCEFENPRTSTVHWGFGDQEMCEMLGFIEASAGFDAEIQSDAPAGDDGATKLFSGPCQSLMLPWEKKL